MSLVAVWDYLATAPTADITSLACVVGFVLWPLVESAVEALRWVARRME